MELDYFEELLRGDLVRLFVKLELNVDLLRGDIVGLSGTTHPVPRARVGLGLGSNTHPIGLGCTTHPVFWLFLIGFF